MVDYSKWDKVEVSSDEEAEGEEDQFTSSSTRPLDENIGNKKKNKEKRKGKKGQGSSSSPPPPKAPQPQGGAIDDFDMHGPYIEPAKEQPVFEELDVDEEEEEEGKEGSHVCECGVDLPNEAHIMDQLSRDLRHAYSLWGKAHLHEAIAWARRAAVKADAVGQGKEGCHEWIKMKNLACASAKSVLASLLMAQARQGSLSGSKYSWFVSVVEEAHGALLPLPVCGHIKHCPPLNQSNYLKYLTTTEARVEAFEMAGNPLRCQEAMYEVVHLHRPPSCFDKESLEVQRFEELEERFKGQMKSLGGIKKPLAVKKGVPEELAVCGSCTKLSRGRSRAPHLWCTFGHDGHIYSYSGVISQDQDAMITLLDRLDLGQGKWEKMQCQQQCLSLPLGPPSLYGVCGDNLVVCYDHTWHLNIKTLTWESLTTTTTSQPPFDITSVTCPPQLYHDPSLQSPTLIIYHPPDLYQYICNEGWKVVGTTQGGKSPVPGPRVGASWWLGSNNCLYMMGGKDSGPGEDQGLAFGDFWKLDVNTSEWSRVEKRGNFPCIRMRAATVTVGRYTYLYGGISTIMAWEQGQGKQTAPAYLCDFFIFDCEVEEWRVVQMEKVPEPAWRAGGNLVVVVDDEGYQRLYLMGGYETHTSSDGSRRDIQDVWELTIDDHFPRKVAEAKATTMTTTDTSSTSTPVTVPSVEEAVASKEAEATTHDDDDDGKACVSASTTVESGGLVASPTSSGRAEAGQEPNAEGVNLGGMEALSLSDKERRSRYSETTDEEILSPKKVQDTKDKRPVVVRKVQPPEEKKGSSSSKAGVLDVTICPLTKAVMKETVIAMDSFNYEREAIEAYIRSKEDNDEPLTSPITGELMEAMIIPNVMLKSMITKIHQASSSTSSTATV